MGMFLGADYRNIYRKLRRYISKATEHRNKKCKHLAGFN